MKIRAMLFLIGDKPIPYKSNKYNRNLIAPHAYFADLAVGAVLVELLAKLEGDVGLFKRGRCVNFDRAIGLL